MNAYEQKIFQALKEKKLISDEQAQKTETNLRGIEGSLESTVRETQGVSADDILKIKSELFGLPPFVVKNLDLISPELLREIPEEAARQYKIVPLEKSGKKLKVGMVNPEDYKAREAIHFIATGGDVDPELYVITDETFRKILGQYRTFRAQIKEALTELEQELKEEKPLPSTVEQAARGMMREAPVTKIVAVILKHAVEGKASDIHIEAGADRTRVRFRVHGKLYTSLFLPAQIYSSVVSRIKILSNLRLDESRIPQDGRFSAEVSGRTIDFRVSTFPTLLGEKVVLRVLDPSFAIQDLPKLGLSGRNLELVQEATKKTIGMVMISGPTGSGKSTTLYAALSSLDRESANVVSLEDPIEYHIQGVNQSQIREDIGYTFASGLRHVLRQDPDIIMVGEVRDSETASLVIHAALTGHLVFSTIHTNSAIGVIPRMIDMGVASFLIPSAISLSVAQRLVSRLCVHCKVAETALPEISAIIKKEIEEMPEEQRARFDVTVQNSYKIWTAPGCDKCGGKGSSGRVGIFEVLVMTTELKKIIYSQANEIKITEEARRQGMMTLRQDGIIKALQGIVAVEEILRVVEES